MDVLSIRPEPAARVTTQQSLSIVATVFFTSVEAHFSFYKDTIPFQMLILNFHTI